MSWLSADAALAVMRASLKAQNYPAFREALRAFTAAMRARPSREDAQTIIDALSAPAMRDALERVVAELNGFFAQLGPDEIADSFQELSDAHGRARSVLKSTEEEK